jgi:pimeloyl-ACP methyl ester carboxylesterase
MNRLNGTMTETSGYARVNGLNMYYEIEGTGDPLVYLPPALACAGLKSFPALVQNHTVITVDFQGHGRTADIPERPITLEQNAKDVVALLKYLGIAKADFFGESYGGATAALIAVHNPAFVRRVATYGATFGPGQVAHNLEMLRFDQPPAPHSPCFAFQRERYRAVAPEPENWPHFWNKVVAIQWGGFSNEELASIKAPLLIALGDHDFIRLEHALETFRLIPGAELAVIPDAGHFALFSEPDRVIAVIRHFLEKPENKIPIATAGTGYRPGETR